jgi:putative CocE/NonD family hydrolase
MNLSHLLVNLLFQLPKPTLPNPTVRYDVPIPMPDGTVLLADLYTPRAQGRYPTILMRTPYGRRGLLSTLFVLPFAENGYNVLYQSTRGTGGSEGDFVYARHEQEDGLATLAWVKQQDWFNGELALAGASYLGFVQWAVAAGAGAELKALAPTVTTSDFNHFRFQGGSYTLETMLGWSTQMTEFARRGQTLRDLLNSGKRQKKLNHAYNHLPLKEADRLIVGQPSQTFQDALAHGPDDDYWQPVDWSHTVQAIDAPVNLVVGWYDLFSYWQLLDYARLRAAGKQPYLLIGPWFHGQPASFGPTAKENLAWFEAHVKGNLGALRKDPVRLFVMGANEWRDYSDWPPPSRPQSWFLQPNGGLTPTTPPADAPPDPYRYNPVDPTPAVGGNSLGIYMGHKDNRALEARADVLVYTSAVIQEDVEVIGAVPVELYVRSTLEYTDFFVRLCVVESSGKSVNLCDGIIRLTPRCESATPQPDGSLCVKFDLWPTANRFKRGQRIRLQVSSGAHPRFPRNPGSGEPVGSEYTLKLAEQLVYHDSLHPSSVTLPITN